MATREEAKQALIDRIAADAADYDPIHLLRLAEAYAWLSATAQSHGGGSASSS